MPTGKMESGCVLSILETAFPHPAEEYADAFFCQEMTAALEAAAKEYKTRFLETVDEIRAGGLESAEFVLRREEKKNKTVNVPLLREEMPDLFAEVVFVSPADAGKLLSKKFLYDATKKLIKDRIVNYEQVNLKDLETRLPAPEFSRYVSERVVPKGYVIEVKS
ncbi:MAG: hypothetical protein Q7J08_00165 [Methanocorpusculum sp.]|uniref:hypothetical protein n=1 Tax=Methanocorpusculum sp. TaxID=2058474 RepID=UPI00271B5937|nr:hypothetical protein [Methanocorpusculum sp.]MDO9522120.1 hypothetical protein [Methanocorpusculum sp.]